MFAAVAAWRRDDTQRMVDNNLEGGAIASTVQTRGIIQRMRPTSSVLFPTPCASRISLRLALVTPDDRRSLKNALEVAVMRIFATSNTAELHLVGVDGVSN